MKIYLIADTHFNHKKLIQYHGRPANVDEILWKYLKELPANCILIHLGDICMGDDLAVHEKIKQLPYKKILIKGNHDKKSNHWYLEHGWDCVCDKLSDHYFGKYVTFSHIPVGGIQNINIHGHLHSDKHRLTGEIKKYYKPKLHKLIAIEFTDYKPVSLEKFLELC